MPPLPPSPPTRRALLAALPAGLLLGALAPRAAAARPPAAARDEASPADPPLRGATLVLVRHAEKADPADPDTGLSARGRARAAALAELLAATRPTHAFASEFRRTRQTLAPLADRAGLDVLPVPARDTASLVERLQGLPDGAVALVAGHSNTVPALAAALGGGLADLDPRGFLREDEYDRVALLALAAVGEAPLRALQTLDLRLALPT